MATGFGLTPELADRVDLAVYMKRAREERAKAISELFGFGFAAAKNAARKVEAPLAGPVVGRPA